MDTQDDIAGVATALVPQAISVIRTSGAGSIERVAGVFSRPAALRNAAGGTMVHGWIVDKGQRVDEVVLGVWRAPRSYTGQDGVEVFCHGGPAVTRAVWQKLLEAGFREAERGEFTLRSFLAGKVDLTQAEAVAEVIAGKTGEEALRAAARLGGGLKERVDHVRQLVLDTLAAIEVQVEYPEDEDNFASTVDLKPLKEAKAILLQLAATWKVERLYQDGVRLVLCGKTNAGKSSLFNALLKEERAIVSATAGTTRDWIEAAADFEGLLVRLFDTAGLREAEGKVEAEGVVRSRNLAESADAILYVADSVRGVDGEDRLFIDEASSRGAKVILALNKCDLAGGAQAREEELAPCDAALRVSAKTGEGLASLVHQVKQLVLGSEASERDAVGLGSARQKRGVEEAAAAVDHAIEVAQSRELGLDAVVQDLEDALSCLAEITGQTTTADVLENIFSRFCVGK